MSRDAISANSVPVYYFMILKIMLYKVLNMQGVQIGVISQKYKITCFEYSKTISQADFEAP